MRPPLSNLDLSETLPLLGELPLAFDESQWPRPPEVGEVEKMAELASVRGCGALEDLGTSVAERDRRYTLPFSRKGAWGPLLREISDSAGSPR